MTASAGPALERLHAEFSRDVSFLTVYVREAHPGERYPQPASFEQKLEHARAYRERDRIPWPVAVDDAVGTLHGLLDPKPAAAYIMDTRGRVAFRSLWANDEGALRRGLRAIAAHPDRIVGEEQTRLVPLLAGAAEMHAVLSGAGESAGRDVLREAAPMYGMGRLAALFRPLPPLGRGIAAAALMALGTAAAGAGVIALVRRARSSG